MLVFIDESGDPGLKLDSGSSSVFVISLVIFKNNEDAIIADKDITEFKKQRRLNEWSEIKFNKSSNDLRRAFLTRAAHYKFKYFGIVINKENLYGEGFKYKSPFYKYACSLVFKNAKEYLDDATVIIDGSGDTDFQRELGTYLKGEINSVQHSCIRKVKLKDSHTNNLIQLADMVSGCIYRSHKKESADSSFRQMIKPLEIYVQVWPK